MASERIIRAYLGKDCSSIVVGYLRDLPRLPFIQQLLYYTDGIRWRLDDTNWKWVVANGGYVYKEEHQTRNPGIRRLDQRLVLESDA
jgi:hypothetical protein